MSPMGNLVVLWGGALLIANVLFDPIFATLRANVIAGQTSVSDLSTSPVHMVLVGLITLLVAGFLANNNPRVAKAILAALAGLTILWLISYNEQKNSPTDTEGNLLQGQSPLSANAATAPSQKATTGQVSGASVPTQAPLSANAVTGYNPSPSGNAYTLPRNPGGRGGYRLSGAAQRLVNSGANQ